MALITIGAGGDYETWAACKAAVTSLTASTILRQISNIPSEPGMAEWDLYLNGYDLTVESNSPPLGNPNDGYITTGAITGGDYLFMLRCRGAGNVEVKDLNFKHVGSGALTAVQVYALDDGGQYPTSVKIHDIMSDAVGGSAQIAFLASLAAVSSEVWNIVATGGSYAAAGFVGSDLVVENVTAKGSTAGVISAEGDPVEFRNCVAINPGSGTAWMSVGAASGYNCAASDDSADDFGTASGYKNNIVPTTEFISIDPANDNYLKLTDEGVLHDGGTTVTIVDNDTGIRGNARPHDGSYSIGADEFASLPEQESDVTDISSGSTNMINHARTLLLNKSGATRPPSTFFGEEVVPQAYAPVELSSSLQTIRRALFGGAPDDAGLNYMLWQYMRVLHSTEFVAYVTALGDRITYMHDRSLLDYPFGPSVLQNSDALQFTGAPDLGGTSGRLWGSWTVDRVAPAVFTLKNLQTGQQSTENPAYAGGVTDYMPMPGESDFKVRVFDVYATQSYWVVEYLAKPTIQMDIVTRAAQLSNIGSEAYAALFPNRAPYKTFKELWENHTHLPYKLSGALLSLIYQIEELRSGG